jgi:hypothetical protein
MRTLLLPASLLLALFPYSPAQAQFAVTFVSTAGNGTNNCASAAAACDTFQRAIDQAQPGGVVLVLNPGNFGPAVITKALSIVASGVEGGILGAPGTTSGLVINAGASDVILLRGLMIALGARLGDGIAFTSGGALHVQNCLIRGGSNGISFKPNATSRLYVSDTAISDSTSAGIRIVSRGVTTVITAVLDRVRLENSGSGIEAVADSSPLAQPLQPVPVVNMTVRDSTIAGIAGHAVHVETIGSTRTTLDVFIERTALVHNGTALHAGRAGVVRVNDSAVSGNKVGFSASGGQIVSFQNNRLIDNDTDGLPTDTASNR